MGKFTHAVCEVSGEFDADFDGSLYRVVKVLQVFENENDAEQAYQIMSPCNFGDWDTELRVVHVDNLQERFR